MPPKKKDRRSISCNKDDVFAVFGNSIRQWVSESSRHESFHQLIKDAHWWGEAMVDAEMAVMAMNDLGAKHRAAQLNTHAQKWYTLGYKYYLVPLCKGSPKSIHHHRCTNSKLMEQSENALLMLAQKAGDVWVRMHSHTLRNAAALAVDTEALSNPPKRQKIHTTAQVAPKVAPPLPSLSTKPKMPGRLLEMIHNPERKTISRIYNLNVYALVRAAFCSHSILRAWNAESGTAASLSVIEEKTALVLQRELEEGGLGVFLGSGQQTEGDAKLRGLGLTKIATGGYNAIWKSSGPNPVLGKLLPAGIMDAFFTGKLVLRLPHVKCEWLTFEQAVAEATNILFTALCNCGPRVAALSFARKLAPDTGSKEEGTVMVKYRIFTFLERATTSVDGRFGSIPSVAQSAASSVDYHNALLVSIYQISQQGYVHLDATLRNFVDFYPQKTTFATPVHGVKIIDVESRYFRRIYSTPTSEWRYAFLLNLMIVLVFLKIRLEDRWNPAIHWTPMRTCALQLISELPTSLSLPALCRWEGTFVPDEKFPDMEFGKYAGDGVEASMNIAMTQMKHYLLQQPINEATVCYVQVVKNKSSTPSQVEGAKVWYDTTYMLHRVPHQQFFKRALKVGPDGPKLFVQVALEFLDKPKPPTRNATHRSTHTFSSNHSRSSMLSALFLP